MIALHCASRQLDRMELLEEDLTCPVCCDLFDDPRVLLCSHSFCRKCLEEIIEGNGAPLFRQPLKCPTCRKETPHNGANSLQINYSLRGIAEKYSKIRGLSRMPICKQHSGQPLNIFCATDLKLICGFCATSDDHEGHKFLSPEVAHEREKEAFTELRQAAESWDSAKILSCVETLQASKNAALQRASDDAEKITHYFESLMSALECKKTEILSNLETHKLLVTQEYDPEITKLNAALEEQRRALSATDSLGSVTDPLCFLQQMQEFRERVRVLRETPLPARKDASAFVRNLDVKKWDSLRLRDVDKISVTHGARGSHHAGRSLTAQAGWIALFLLVLFLALFLLQAHSPKKSARPSQVELFVNKVSTHLIHTGGLCWQQMRTFVGAGRE